MTASTNVSTDELLGLLGAKELELFAARRDAARQAAEQRERYQENLRHAERKITCLRRKLEDAGVICHKASEAADCESMCCDEKREPKPL